MMPWWILVICLMAGCATGAWMASQHIGMVVAATIKALEEADYLEVKPRG